MKLQFGKITKLGDIIGDDRLKTKVDETAIFRAGQQVAAAERHEIRVRCMSAVDMMREFEDFVKFIMASKVKDTNFEIDRSGSGDFFYIVKSYTKII